MLWCLHYEPGACCDCAMPWSSLYEVFPEALTCKPVRLQRLLEEFCSFSFRSRFFVCFFSTRILTEHVVCAFSSSAVVPSRNSCVTLPDRDFTAFVGVVAPDTRRGYLSCRFERQFAGISRVCEVSSEVVFYVSRVAVEALRVFFHKKRSSWEQRTTRRRKRDVRFT